MRRDKFCSEIAECYSILYKLDMNVEYVSKPSFPSSPLAFFKGKSYPEIWKTCLTNRFYHFQLFDNSLIYYSFDSHNCFSMGYYEFPYEAKSYLEFIEIHGFTYQDIGDEFMEEYDEYLTTCEFKKSVSPVRYDINYDQYKKGRHPVSHLHIGFQNNIRIRTAKIMSPLSFIFFLLRQFYPDKWIQLLDNKLINNIFLYVRDNLNEIKKGYFDEIDNFEVYLK